MNFEEDDLFGEITILVDASAGLVEVSGPRIPRARLTRRPGAKHDPYCLIGSRDGANLALRVASTDGRVAPARGGLTRRSYRVDAYIYRVTYRLVPDGSGTSALRRAGERIGRFTADHQGSVRAEWEMRRGPEPSYPGAVTERLEHRRIEPTDAAVGYLLAAGYGTGAPPAWEVLLHGLVHVPIG